MYRFNQQSLWQFLVYRIVDLHKSLGIYFCIIIDSKNIMKPCSFLIKQEYFLPKKKHILPSIFVSSALYLSASSRFPRVLFHALYCRRRYCQWKSAQCNPFSYTLETLLFLQREKFFIWMRLLSRWTEGYCLMELFRIYKIIIFLWSEYQCQIKWVPRTASIWKQAADILLDCLKWLYCMWRGS